MNFGRDKIIGNFLNMPLFFQHDIDDSTKLAIWKIVEDESFFSEYVPLQRTITHPFKRLQHLAGRYLLQYLFPDFPISLILIADTRKPYLEDETHHFSISHCHDYAAVIVSKTKRVGVDIELLTPKIERIQHKFVSPEEQTVFQKGDNNTLSIMNLTLIWSCKEAVFKWYGKGALDFRQHMTIQKVVSAIDDQYFTEMAFKKNEDQLLGLHSFLLGDAILSYIVTSAEG